MTRYYAGRLADDMQGKPMLAAGESLLAAMRKARKEMSGPTPAEIRIYDMKRGGGYVARLEPGQIEWSVKP